MKKLRAVLFLAILILPADVLATEEGSRSQRLDEVVVSATRSEIAVVDAPQSVTVISEKEIMASPFERVEDILRFSAGIYNTSHYGWQTGGRISHLSMRGTGRNRMLMMIDGVPLNDNFNNTIAWVAWGLIPREAIERIEIVRGPTSAAYGSEGLGGVINIITKNPAKKRQSSVKATAGSGKTYGASAFHSQTISDAGFLVSADYEQSDGFYMVDPEGIEAYTTKRHRDSLKGFGKATYMPGDRTNIVNTTKGKRLMGRKQAEEEGLAVLSAFFSTHYAKSLFSPSDAAKKSAGLRFEILPLKDPMRAKPGDEIAFKVLFDEKPLSGLSLYTQNGDKATTDAAGTARLTMPDTDKVLLYARHRIDVKGDDQKDYEIFTTFLTFEANHEI